MGTAIQYDFFETKEESEFKAIEKRIDNIDESCHKIRKSLFAKNGEINKRQLDLEYRLEILERHICQK